MIQTELIAQEVTAEGYFDLGSVHVLHLPLGPRHHGDLYFQGNFIKRVNLADKSKKRIFVVELLQKDINPCLTPPKIPQQINDLRCFCFYSG